MAYSPFLTAVTISEPQDHQPSMPSESAGSLNSLFSQNTRQHRPTGARRLTGRPNRHSVEQLPNITSQTLTKSPSLLPAGDGPVSDIDDLYDDLLAQVKAWLQDEKAKKLKKDSASGKLSGPP